MNLSKVLKQKRDAEDRLRNRSPVTVFSETATGEQSFKNTGEYATKKDLEGKSDISHNHDLNYAALDHNHDSLYMKIGQTVKAKIYEPLVSPTSDFFYHNGDILTGEVV